MFYRLLIVAFCLTAANAFAQSQINSFNWKTNGSFHMQMVLNGAPVDFKGEIAEENGETSSQTDGYTAYIRTYPSFVSIIAGRDGDELAYLFLLEKKNKDFEQMNIQPITGRSAEMVDDLKYSLERFAALKGLDGKDPSFAFRTMVAYFEDGPGKTLDAFASDVENGVEVVRVVPPPTTKDTASAGPAVQPPAPRNQRAQPQDQGQPRYEDPNGYPIEPGFDDPYTQDIPQPKRRKRQPVPPADIPWDQQTGVDPNYYPPPPGTERRGGVGDFIPDWAKPRQQPRRQAQQPVRRQRPQTQRDLYLQGGGLY